MSSSTDALLRRIRTQIERDPNLDSARRGGGRTVSLDGVPDADLPRTPGGAEGLENFRETLGRVGGQTHVVADEAGAARALEGILERIPTAERPRLAHSDASIVARVLGALASGPFDKEVEALPDRVDSPVDRRALLDSDLGLSAAQIGIAETGTLALVSDAERHRLVSLVPPVHVALLELDDLVGTLEEALQRMQDGRPGGVPARAVTWITGPSRTADIELTLVVGVHGPRELHVIIIQRNR